MWLVSLTNTTVIRCASLPPKIRLLTLRTWLGRIIGAQRATIASSWLEENAKEAQLKLYDTQENVFLDLALGRLDAIFADSLVLYQWLQTEEGCGFRMVGEAYLLDEGIGIAVRQDDNELRPAAQRGPSRYFSKWNL